MTSVIVSTRLANGQRSDIAHYNNLRADILAHDHSPGQGAVINHGDLADGVVTNPADTYLDHDALDTHVQGGGSSPDPDSGGGGAYGVHGLPSSAYVAGSLTSQCIVQYGIGTTDNTVTIGTDEGETHVDQWTNVYFDTAFGDTPAVVITARAANYQSVRVSVQNVSTTLFSARVGYAYDTKNQNSTPTQFNWLAIGPAP
jgi:hypothetical protein